MNACVSGSVHEVDEAEQVGVLVRSAMSKSYTTGMLDRVKLFMDQGFLRAEDCLEAAGVTVHTIQARCGYASDEAMLVEQIRQKQGKFERLDKVVQALAACTTWCCMNMMTPLTEPYILPL